MARLVFPQVYALDMDRRPAMRRSPLALKPEGAVTGGVAVACRGAACPQHTAGGRIEPAFLGEALERRPVFGVCFSGVDFMWPSHYF